MKSIIQDNKFCFECGTGYGLHRHHIFYGKNRKLSEEDGLVVYLCYEHHEGNNGVHGHNTKLNEKLKEIGQRAYMIKYNKTKEDFIKRYGKNYLTDE